MNQNKSSAKKKGRGIVLSLVNNKGGCGKTTSSVSLSAALADMNPNMRVCLVDIDPQGDATLGIGVTSEVLEAVELTSYDLLLHQIPAENALINFNRRFQGKLSAIPASDDLEGLHRILEREIDRELFTGVVDELTATKNMVQSQFRLRDSIESLRDLYDVIVIDTPPSKGFLMVSAIVASDYFIIPVFPSAFDLKGLGSLTVAVEKIRDALNPSLQLAGILVGGAKRGRKGEMVAIGREVRSKLKDVFGDTAVFDTIIYHSVRNAEAPGHNETILEYDPNGAPSDQFRALAKEFVNRVQKTRSNATLRPLPDFQEFAESVQNASVPIESLIAELAANG